MHTGDKEFRLNRLRRSVVGGLRSDPNLEAPATQSVAVDACEGLCVGLPRPSAPSESDHCDALGALRDVRRRHGGGSLGSRVPLGLLVSRWTQRPQGANIQEVIKEAVHNDSGQAPAVLWPPLRGTGH